eukprot:7427074-Pyramimonas_sp.AAC.1
MCIRDRCVRACVRACVCVCVRFPRSSVEDRSTCDLRGRGGGRRRARKREPPPSAQDDPKRAPSLPKEASGEAQNGL